MLQLRDYQTQVIFDTYKFFHIGLKSVLLYAPTGAGKTAIASQIIADYVGQGKRVLFLVHRTKLVRQTQDTLQKFHGIDCSVIWASEGKPDYSKPVQVAMLQSLHRRELPPDIDLVILDEGHTSSYFSTYQRILNQYSGGIWALSKTLFLGLSATPWRTKKQEGYCHVFEAVVRAPYPQQLIDLGHLSRARQFGYVGLIDESKLEVSRDTGEFTDASIAEVCDEALNLEIVNKYSERDPKGERKVLAFCASVKQALDLTLKLKSRGYLSEIIIGETPESDRSCIFEKFTKSEIKILVSVAVLCEGFDEPSADCVLICRPVKSRALFIQMVGRGLRIAKNKEDCWIIDYCGNIKRLGLPTQRYPISLCPHTHSDDDEPISTKTCPSCGQEIYAFLMICPHCGHVFEPEKIDLVPRKGKLEEILSPDQRTHFKFLKELIVGLYNKRAPNTEIDLAFLQKWGYLPPEDWYDSILFGDKHGWEVDVQVYYRYLLEALPGGSTQTREWIEKSIRREFKSAIAWAEENFYKNYKLHLPPVGVQRSAHENGGASRREASPTEDIQETINRRIKDLISYKTWWKLLGFTQEPTDLSLVYDAYQQRLREAETWKRNIFEQRAKLYNLALEQSVARFSLSPRLLLLTAGAIKRAIAAQDFQAAEEHASSVTAIARETIWSMLDPTERSLFARYRRGELNKPVQVAKPTYTQHGAAFYHKSHRN
ncbi:DEAD/DEAH box helicase [Scytonema hofmannii FACHB-248]|uniref:DEAD/DEAH box helicase n=1 Tax=Scytonema hofmannii FACHB-248 TaxID=1842502 RepID=A0ABR8GL53_9CYAN|nr:MULTISPECIES: DEAD/DEAH box helicase [Nostocales]MBD2603880.1 DEAD/DEAH box helicase [Scytonema hofmannii FACHB-248]